MGLSRDVHSFRQVFIIPKSQLSILTQISNRSPEVMEYLIRKSAEIDVLNKSGCSALHVAVNKQHVDCVKVLIKHKCNVNLQDCYGDTALHDAIGRDSKAIIDELVDCGSADLTLRNKRGFNVVHHAALKGSVHTIDKIIGRARQLVDIRKDDGFAALHLCCLNGHRNVADLLITKGEADIEIENSRRQTPLMLAISQGHADICELLVQKEANAKAVDEDGDTCLHMALNRHMVQIDLSGCTELSQLSEDLPPRMGKTGVVIACFLVQKGAPMDTRNTQGTSIVGQKTISMLLCRFVSVYLAHAPTINAPSGKTPLHCISDEKVAAEVNAILSKYKLSTIVKCIICHGEAADVKFEPCGHVISCRECSLRMPKCLKCGAAITEKFSGDGMSLAEAEKEYREMLSRLHEIEETITCPICMDRRRDVAFLCGHQACKQCSLSLRNCHICREPISQKINLFNE